VQSSRLGGRCPGTSFSFLRVGQRRCSAGEEVQLLAAVGVATRLGANFCGLGGGELRRRTRRPQNANDPRSRAS
jgi:hypothetical protein